MDPIPIDPPAPEIRAAPLALHEPLAKMTKPAEAGFWASEQSD